MKAQRILFLVDLLFLNSVTFGHFPTATNKASGGCGVFSCSTSNGIYVVDNMSLPNERDSVHVASIDSMVVYLKAGSCILSFTSIKIDGQPANYIYKSGTYSGEIRLLSAPGKYEIRAVVDNHPNGLNFTLILDPVGLAKLSNESEDEVSVFPNPASKELNILSKTLELKNVRIYSSLGREIEPFDAMGSEIQIPLNSYSPGIYFIHVATLNNKVIIKKISVL